MADVFISYASEDHDRAGMLANALSALGWAVWWDRKIITGQAFDHVIERELEAAKSVVVLWSRYSIASEWVKNEATAASERGVLVPAMIDNVKLPLEFRRKQTAELVGWKGNTSHSGFQALCEGIATMNGGPPPQQPISSQTQKAPWSLRRVLAVTTAVFAVFAGIAAAFIFQFLQDNSRGDNSIKIDGRIISARIEPNNSPLWQRCPGAELMLADGGQLGARCSDSEKFVYLNNHVWKKNNDILSISFIDVGALFSFDVNEIGKEKEVSALDANGRVYRLFVRWK